MEQSEPAETTGDTQDGSAVLFRFASEVTSRSTSAGSRSQIVNAEPDQDDTEVMIRTMMGDPSVGKGEGKSRSALTLIEALIEERLEAMFAALAHGHMEVRRTAEQAADLAQKSEELARSAQGECARLTEWLQESLRCEGLALPALPFSPCREGSAASASGMIPASSIAEVLEQNVVSRAVAEARAESLTLINTEFDQWRSDVAHEVSHALIDVAEHSDRLLAMEGRMRDIEDIVRESQAMVSHEGKSVRTQLPRQPFAQENICVNVSGQELAYTKHGIQLIGDVTTAVVNAPPIAVPTSQRMWSAPAVPVERGAGDPSNADQYHAPGELTPGACKELLRNQIRHQLLRKQLWYPPAVRIGSPPAAVAAENAAPAPLSPADSSLQAKCQMHE